MGNIREVLGKAGRAALRAFAVAALTYSTGILAAPNLDQAYALGVAALAACVAAAFTAVQVYIPLLAFQGKYAELLNDFVRGTLAAFTVSIVGILNAPTLDFSRAAVTGLVVGALMAGLRALQGAVTPGDAAEKFGTTGV